MVDVVLFAAGLLAIVVAATFGDLQRWSISPPFLGLTVGVLLGPQVLDVVSLPGGTDLEVLRVATRLLLAVALMAIALRYPTADSRARVREVLVLLLVVLPVMFAVLTVGGVLFLGLPVGLALVLGAALSPTDPVLASGIVTGEPAERDIPATSRQVLSLESGANDGLAMPLVVLTLGVALGEPMAGRVGTAVYEVLGAVAVGVAAGTASGATLRWAESKRELGTAERSLYTLVLAAAVLGLGGLLHVDGLLAVFVAGLAHNRLVTIGDRQSEVAVDEALNQFLVLPVFVLFGAALPWAQWSDLGWGAAAFVFVAFTLRRLPAVVLLRRPLRTTSTQALWLGWFGPIGVAALFYVTHARAEGVTDHRIWAAGSLVVAASTVVHGLTAGPSRVLVRGHRSGQRLATSRRSDGQSRPEDHS